jgi:peptide/nickel transport system substrate-binding protein
VRHSARALFVGVLAAGLFTAGCTQNTGGNTPGPGQSAANTDLIMDFAGTAPTPAPAPVGGKPGGTITILSEGDFEFLDPQNVFVTNATQASILFHRALVGYVEDPKGGATKVVGDLATNAGVTADNGKTWTYTLRDGIKFEDGSPIEAKDVAYGIARAFSDFGAEGPPYLKVVLDPAGTYKGPYGGQLVPPSVEVVDAKTIKFNLSKPAPELPFLLSFAQSTPVPQAKDTKEQYNTAFVSTGPYKIKSYVRDTKLTLERNSNWDPATDPIRTAYADSFEFDFTVTGEAQANRLIADSGADKTALMGQNVPPSLIASVKANAEVMPRVDTSASTVVYYININTQRVTDLAVRQALNHAFDRAAYIKAAGGEDVRSPSTTLLSKVTPGWKDYNAYAFDIEKAKTLIAGKTVPTFKYCSADTAVNQEVAAVNIAGLKKAGFNAVASFIAPADYYETIGTKSTDCDLMTSGWLQDWPDGHATIGALWDGATIADTGNNNYSYLNDPGINAKIVELRDLTDRGVAGAQYGELDEKLMKEFAPVIPLAYGRNFAIAGSGLGNVFMSPIWSEFSLAQIYVK